MEAALPPPPQRDASGTGGERHAIISADWYSPLCLRIARVVRISDARRGLAAIHRTTGSSGFFRVAESHCTSQKVPLILMIRSKSSQKHLRHDVNRQATVWPDEASTSKSQVFRTGECNRLQQHRKQMRTVAGQESDRYEILSQPLIWQIAASIRIPFRIEFSLNSSSERG
jgi:hypothetical protein